MKKRTLVILGLLVVSCWLLVNGCGSSGGSADTTTTTTTATTTSTAATTTSTTPATTTSTAATTTSTSTSTSTSTTLHLTVTGIVHPGTSTAETAGVYLSTGSNESFFAGICAAAEGTFPFSFSITTREAGTYYFVATAPAGSMPPEYIWSYGGAEMASIILSSEESINLNVGDVTVEAFN